MNLAGDGGGTWSSLLTSVHEDRAGTFDFGVNCTNCGPQNGGVETSISFDVTGSGMTTDSFHFLSSGGSRRHISRRRCSTRSTRRAPA